MRATVLFMGLAVTTSSWGAGGENPRLDEPVHVCDSLVDGAKAKPSPESGSLRRMIVGEEKFNPARDKLAFYQFLTKHEYSLVGLRFDDGEVRFGMVSTPEQTLTQDALQIRQLDGKIQDVSLERLKGYGQARELYPEISTADLAILRKAVSLRSLKQNDRFLEQRRAMQERFDLRQRGISEQEIGAYLELKNWLSSQSAPLAIDYQVRGKRKGATLLGVGFRLPKTHADLAEKKLTVFIEDANTGEAQKIRVSEIVSGQVQILPVIAVQNRYSYGELALLRKILGLGPILSSDEGSQVRIVTIEPRLWRFNKSIYELPRRLSPESAVQSFERDGNIWITFQFRSQEIQIPLDIVTGVSVKEYSYRTLLAEAGRLGARSRTQTNSERVGELEEALHTVVSTLGLVNPQPK